MARVTAAGTLGRGELGIVVDRSVCLLLSLSVRNACDGVGVRGFRSSAADWCSISGAGNRRDMVPVVVFVFVNVAVGGAERSSVEEAR